MNKVNLFYPFDRGFFGKTLITAVKSNIKSDKISKLEFDSADDFNHHFYEKLFKQSYERTPQTDKFVHGEDTPNMMQPIVDFISNL